jgi:uridylate kinase
MAPARRILLKLSGEALMGPDSFGYHAERPVVGQIREVWRWVQVGVVSGGNCFAAPPVPCPG